MSTAYVPDLLYLDGAFLSDRALIVNAQGQVERVAGRDEVAPEEIIHLPGKAMLPGFVNAHSHSFQRLIRGRAESRAVSGRDFWSWRGTMYHAAAQLTPEDVYDVARMAFLEMLLGGTTSVGEFHYLHTDPNGRPYDDPNLLSRKIIAAAESVGIRLVLLRSAYQRSGYQVPRDPGQTRFFESTHQFLEYMTELVSSASPHAQRLHFGVAPHSIRAVPLDDIVEIAEWGRDRGLPVHMHVAEQTAENDACTREYGCTPVELLSRNGLLQPGFTAVHAIHISVEEIAQVAASGGTICSCPTTERNLGDGIFPADRVMEAGIRVALGSDSQAQIDCLEDARELDYHLRLRDQQRAVLDQFYGQPIAEQLFHCATSNGAEALRISAGGFVPGAYADAFTIDLDDVSVAGNSAADLLPIVVFSLTRSAVRDVIVHGRRVITEQQHPHHAEIVARYRQLHARVWRRPR